MTTVARETVKVDDGLSRELLGGVRAGGSGTVPSKNEPTWRVMDTNAPHEEVRIHTVIVNGRARPCPLSSDNFTEMPMSEALQFTKDETYVSFLVLDEHGDIVKPAKKSAPPDGRIKLGPGEVVADLEELSSESLFRRCRTYSDSQHTLEETSRGEMVAFLLNKANPRPETTGAEGDFSASLRGQGMEAMSVADAARLVPLDPVLASIGK